jgi:hypothetical protein
MKLHNALTYAQIVNLQGSDKIKRYSDGECLYLEVTPKGYKYWRLKFRIGSKEKRLSLGVFPQVDIETARNSGRRVRRSHPRTGGEVKNGMKLLATPKNF